MNLKRFTKETTDELVSPAEFVTNGILRTTIQDGNAIVQLSGKIDVSNFEEIQEKSFELINTEDIHTFVFDMNDVEYVSSAALRMFSAINHKANEQQVSYKLIKMREDIMKLFQMTGYASAFYIELKEEN